jgi:regulator of sirC expression with transglutaminase-like and TPR domain
MKGAVMSERINRERQFLAEIDARNREFSPLRAALALSQAADPHRLPSAVLTVLLGPLPGLDARLKALGKPYQKLEALGSTFFEELGFSALDPAGLDDAGDQGLSAVELHRVTERRRGRPLSLGLLYYELGRRLGLPLRPLAHPGGVLFASHWLPAGQVIDPASGRIQPMAETAHKLELGFSGTSLSMQAESPRSLSARQLLERYLVSIRAAAMADGDTEQALRAAHWRVLLVPDSISARWDRGLLLYRLDRYEEAEADLGALRRSRRRSRRAPAGGRGARAEVNHLLASLDRSHRAP